MWNLSRAGVLSRERAERSGEGLWGRWRGLSSRVEAGLRWPAVVGVAQPDVCMLRETRGPVQVGQLPGLACLAVPQAGLLCVWTLHSLSPSWNFSLLSVHLLALQVFIEAFVVHTSGVMWVNNLP